MRKPDVVRFIVEISEEPEGVRLRIEGGYLTSDDPEDWSVLRDEVFTDRHALADAAGHDIGNLVFERPMSEWLDDRET